LVVPGSNTVGGSDSVTDGEAIEAAVENTEDEVPADVEAVIADSVVLPVNVVVAILGETAVKF
jgi:hypothetical protein